jgi:hypothetical protein
MPRDCCSKFLQLEHCSFHGEGRDGLLRLIAMNMEQGSQATFWDRATEYCEYETADFTGLSLS